MYEIRHIKRSAAESNPPEPVPPAPTPATAPTTAPQSSAANHDFGALAVYPQSSLTMSVPGDASEQEAERVADRVMRKASPDAPPPAIGPASALGGVPAPAGVEARLERTSGQGAPLTDETRLFMEPRFGADLSRVRLHTGPVAAGLSRDLQAEAFTHGQNIYFGEGKSPTDHNLLSHELAHTLQANDGAVARKILRKIDSKYTVPAGEFNVNVTTGQSNLPISIKFHPAVDAPYSNQIGLIQIYRLQSKDGKNVNAATMPAARAASLRTTADAATGAQADYVTDALHKTSGGPTTPAGTDLPPQYPFGTGPAQPTPTTPGLSRPQSFGSGGQIIGYKRSNEPGDIKDAEMTDAPGYPTINPANQDINFDFETVAKGEDTMVIFGSLKWSFQIRAGVVTGETASVAAGASATFDAALAKHRAVYVHEPVVFYFGFDSDKMTAEETVKIDEFLNYVKTTPDIRLDITGYADRRGGKSQHNLDLSLRRAGSVEKALRDKGIPGSQIDSITLGLGATEDFTPDATTDQDSDANRRGNRRVVVTFKHVPAAPAPAGAGAGAGAGSAPAPSGSP